MLSRLKNSSASTPIYTSRTRKLLELLPTWMLLEEVLPIYHWRLLEGSRNLFQECSRDFILECSRDLFLESSRNLSLEGSKDYVPNITPSFSFEVSEKQCCWQSVPTQKDEDLPHNVCYELQLLFTRQVVHWSLQPTVVAHAFHF